VSRATRVKADALSIAESVERINGLVTAATTRADYVAIRGLAVDAAASIDASRRRLDVITASATFTKATDLLDASKWIHDTRFSYIQIRASMLGVVAACDSAISVLPAANRWHTVKAGETPQSIAAVELGDWQRWPDLMDANGLDPAATLTAGAPLLIPGRA